jgi:hypothetical protein
MFPRSLKWRLSPFVPGLWFQVDVGHLHPHQPKPLSSGSKHCPTVGSVLMGFGQQGNRPATTQLLSIIQIVSAGAVAVANFV